MRPRTTSPPVARVHVRARPGLRDDGRRTCGAALVVGGDVLSRILDWRIARPASFLATARARSCSSGSRRGLPWLRARRRRLGWSAALHAGRRLALPASAETVAERKHFAHMNGREVFKFATRVLVSSAETVLARCGRAMDDVDVYVPHQANVRIIDHAVGKLGIPGRKLLSMSTVRQHVLGLDSARARRGAGGRAASRRRYGADDRHGRRPHLGLGFDGMEARNEQDRVLLPWAGVPRVRHGPGDRRARSGGDAVSSRKAARRLGSICSGSASTLRWRSSSRPNCSSPRSSPRASPSSLPFAREGSSPTTSSATRSASTPRLRPHARCRCRGDRARARARAGYG